MKSIREWMKEKGMIGEDISSSNFARFMGGTSFDIDVQIKKLLRPRVEQILNMDEYKNLEPGEVFKKIVAAVGAIETEMGGTKGSISSLAKRINAHRRGLADTSDQIAQETK
jgi:hypothetical protein